MYVETILIVEQLIFQALTFLMWWCWLYAKRFATLWSYFRTGVTPFSVRG